MRERFLSLLRCPGCRGPLSLAEVRGRLEDDVREGELACDACASVYPVRGGIPVFVPEDDYADSFGWQWTRWAHLQRDSYNGSTLVRDTILKRTGFTPEFLREARLLECGCGSGNDTEVLQALCREVVSVDLSRGVHAAAPHVRTAHNGMLLQGDLRAVPVAEGAFDVVYCHRVIQHTPEPEAVFRSIARHVRPGGVLFLHSYDTHWTSLAHFKYLWRPLTRRLPHAVTHRVLRVLGPLLYPLAGLFHRIRPLRRLGKLLVPFEYHGRILEKAGAKLSLRERYEYSYLVTFDALTPAHDHPNPPEELVGWFEEAGFEAIEVRQRRPVCVVGRRPADAAAPRPAPATREATGAR